jgi:quercetin dioxygenase-like cupin family protein
MVLGRMLLSLLAFGGALAPGAAVQRAAPVAEPVGAAQNTPIVQAGPSEKPLVRMAGEPPDEAYDNSKARFLVSSPGWSLAELEEAPKYKTPLHRHPGWDESFYVLSGALTVHVNGQSYELTPGSFMSIAKGTPHGQANFGTVPVRFLLDMRPGGFERHLKDRIALARSAPPQSPDFRIKMDEVRRKNADLIEILGSWER